MVLARTPVGASGRKAKPAAVATGGKRITGGEKSPSKDNVRSRSERKPSRKGEAIIEAMMPKGGVLGMLTERKGSADDIKTESSALPDADDSSSSDEEEKLLQSKLLRYEDDSDDESEDDAANEPNEGEAPSNSKGQTAPSKPKLLSYVDDRSGKLDGALKQKSSGKPNEGAPKSQKTKSQSEEKPLTKPRSESREESKDDDDDDVEDTDSEVSQSDAEDEDDGAAADGKTEGSSKPGKGPSGVDRRESILMKRLRNEVRRQIKTSKKFELRKVIREIKTAKEKTSGDQNKIDKIEAKLKALKAIDVRALALRAMADKTRESEAEDSNDDEPKAQKEEDTLDARMERKVLDFKGVQTALNEFIERPKRERAYREYQKKKQQEIEKKEAKKLERETYTLVCGIGNCTAKFASEEARTVHRVKRHHTTGDLKTDMTMGLRESRPGQRDRKAFALLKAGAAPDEIERVRNPKKARKAEDAGDEHKKKEKRPLRIGAESSEAKRPRRQEKAPTRSRSVSNVSTGSSQPSSKPPKAENKSGEEKLHPSWEAKRKTTQLVEFQGQAVEFSDDE